MPKFWVVTPLAERNAVITEEFMTSKVRLAKALPNIEHMTSKGVYILLSRNAIAEQARKSGMEGLLWIDSDMGFDPSDVAMMMSLVEKTDNLAIIAGMYPSSKLPADAIWGLPLHVEASGFGVLHQLTNFKTGFGFVWTPMECFRMIRYPWFSMPHGPDGYVGEDSYFFQCQAREWGMPSYVAAFPGLTHEFRCLRCLNEEYDIMEKRPIVS
jgi:hypothetical protein